MTRPEAFDYCDEVNDNLRCAICHCPFVEPVTLHACLHTFCRECLVGLELCPVDRREIQGWEPANRLISNMCNELKVRCAHCSHVMERQLLDSHLRQQEQCDRCMQLISPACTLHSEFHECTILRSDDAKNCPFRLCEWEGKGCLSEHLQAECLVFAEFISDQRQRLVEFLITNSSGSAIAAASTPQQPLADDQSTKPVQLSTSPSSPPVQLNHPLNGDLNDAFESMQNELMNADNNCRAGATIDLLSKQPWRNFNMMDPNWLNMLHMQSVLQRQLISLQNELHSMRNQFWAMERRQQYFNDEKQQSLQKHHLHQRNEVKSNDSASVPPTRPSLSNSTRMKL